jgi:uncharacterized protein YjbI with pentapeptide repeats
MPVLHHESRACAEKEPMANQEHMKILTQGAKAWNQWVVKNPKITLDLTEANLSGADLSGYLLEGGQFRQANLSGAHLSRSALTLADFSSTDLSRANFQGASLSGAILRQTNLKNANLSKASLSFAYCDRAQLDGANLEGAFLEHTIFARVDLSQIIGLESVHHGGPSEISISTLYGSQGKIPEIFLRGAGVPEVFIANMRSLVAAMSPIDFYSCFISYSSKDQEFAERLYADLQAKGVRCWYAPEDLKIGDKFRQRIDDAIRVHDKLLVVLSETSVASSWVESEVESAFEKERGSENKTVLFPIRLDDAVMETGKAWAADIRRTRHMGDFSHWQDHNSYQKAFQRLLRDLQGEKATPAPVTLGLRPLSEI